MKHIVKILTLLVTISSLWVGLLQTDITPCSHTWLPPIYSIVSIGCYGLLMVGLAWFNFQLVHMKQNYYSRDVVDAKEFLKQKGINMGYCD